MSDIPYLNYSWLTAILLLLSTTTVTCIEHNPSTQKIGYNIGDTVPNFSLTLTGNQTISSQELIKQGKPTFLFFTTTW